MYCDKNSAQALQLNLPVFSPALARLTRILFDARFAALIAPHSLSPGSAPGGAIRLQRPAHLHLRCEYGEIRLLVDLYHHPALESTALAGHGDLQVMLAGALLKNSIAQAMQAGLPALQVSLLELTETAIPDDSIALRFNRGQQEETVVVTAIDSGVLDALENAMRCAAAPLPLPAFLTSLRLPGRARIGSRFCTPALLSSLRAGDVLLNWQGGSGDLATLADVKLYWGAPRGLQYLARAHIDHDTIILETTPAMTFDEEHLTPQAGHDYDKDSVDIAALELPVNLEIVTMALPLEQIGAMQAGHVLELPLALRDASIRLSAYGQTLGFGQLVMVGEHLGLQVSAMAKKNESDA